MAFLLWLIIGAIAGWIAGELMRGDGFGLIGNIVVGIVGSFIGGSVFGMLGLSSGNGLVGSVVTATIGAMILLFAISFVRRSTA